MLKTSHLSRLYYCKILFRRIVKIFIKIKGSEQEPSIYKICKDFSQTAFVPPVTTERHSAFH